MTVAELITLLQKMPQDARVYSLQIAPDAFNGVLYKNPDPRMPQNGGPIYL